MSRHRPPPPPLLTRPRVAIADGALLTAALAAAALTAAPHTPQPTPTALPTAVELREPTGHGGLGGPLTPPTFADPHVWTEDKGPVIVNGQALPRPTVVARMPAAKVAPTPKTQSPAATPVAEPTPAEPVVTPEVTPTEPVETTEPMEPPAEPTAPVVVEVVP